MKGRGDGVKRCMEKGKGNGGRSGARKNVKGMGEETVQGKRYREGRGEETGQGKR